MEVSRICLVPLHFVLVSLSSPDSPFVVRSGLNLLILVRRIVFIHANKEIMLCYIL